MRHRCRHCGKATYPNYRVAARAARRAPIPARVYWHPEAGAYCITRLELGEYNARRARGDAA